MENATFFEMKEACKVSCLEIIAWTIVVKEDTNTQIYMVLNAMLNLLNSIPSFYVRLNYDFLKRKSLNDEEDW